MNTAKALVCLLLTLLAIVLPAQAAEQVTYYHHDVLGSPIAATDENGDLLWDQEYDAWGYPQLTVPDTRSYTGAVREDETGLVDMQARWYSPAIGRMTALDPPGFREDSIQSFNLYAYAKNNPYRYVDPNGEIPLLVVAVWAAGAALTAYDTHQAYQEGGTRAAAQTLAIDGVITAVGGGVAKGAHSLWRASRLTKGAGQALDEAPDFVVSPGGTAFPVPKGATGPAPVVSPAGKTTGSAFTGGKGGANGKVDTMRIMNPTPPRGKSPGYPNGYIKYENQSGQGVDPHSGRTLSNKDSHFPIE